MAERLHVPVVTTGNGRGAISECHPLALGRAGYGGGNAVADEALRRADFILGIGCTMSDITTYEYTWPIQADIVVVNLDRDNDCKPMPMEAVYGDARLFLEGMATFVVKQPENDCCGWIEEFQPPRAAWKNLLDSARIPDAIPFRPPMFAIASPPVSRKTQ